MFRRLFVFILSFSLIADGLHVSGLAWGASLSAGPSFSPAILLKGVQIDPQNPLTLNLLIDPGQSSLPQEEINREILKTAKYFLSAVTIPEEDLWVNLSPVESGRIVPESFGQTDMGQDLLSQDYVLKQLTASLLSPEGETGKAFWDHVYRKAHDRGVSEIPLEAFHKVWIVPAKAIVYKRPGMGIIAESRLKILMEEDHLMDKGGGKKRNIAPEEDSLTGIMREVILPEIERQVNEGSEFSNLRQIYNAVILATWFKRNLRQSIIAQASAERLKVGGLLSDDDRAVERIYQGYLKAFEKGFNNIKEEYDPRTQDVVARRYITGGSLLKFGPNDGSYSEAADVNFASLVLPGFMKAQIKLNGMDAAMMASRKDKKKAKAAEAAEVARKKREEEALKKSLTKESAVVELVAPEEEAVEEMSDDKFLALAEEHPTLSDLEILMNVDPQLERFQRLIVPRLFGGEAGRSLEEYFQEMFRRHARMIAQMTNRKEAMDESSHLKLLKWDGTYEEFQNIGFSELYADVQEGVGNTEYIIFSEFHVGLSAAADFTQFLPEGLNLFPDRWVLVQVFISEYIRALDADNLGLWGYHLSVTGSMLTNYIKDEFKDSFLGSLGILRRMYAAYRQEKENRVGDFFQTPTLKGVDGLVTTKGVDKLVTPGAILAQRYYSLLSLGNTDHSLRVDIVRYFVMEMMTNTSKEINNSAIIFLKNLQLSWGVDFVNSIIVEEIEGILDLRMMHLNFDRGIFELIERLNAFGIDQNKLMSIQVQYLKEYVWPRLVMICGLLKDHGIVLNGENGAWSIDEAAYLYSPPHENYPFEEKISDLSQRAAAAAWLARALPKALSINLQGSTDSNRLYEALSQRAEVLIWLREYENLRVLAQLLLNNNILRNRYRMKVNDVLRESRGNNAQKKVNGAFVVVDEYDEKVNEIALIREKGEEDVFKEMLENLWRTFSKEQKKSTTVKTSKDAQQMTAITIEYDYEERQVYAQGVVLAQMEAWTVINGGRVFILEKQKEKSDENQRQKIVIVFPVRESWEDFGRPDEVYWTSLENILTKRALQVDQITFDQKEIETAIKDEAQYEMALPNVKAAFAFYRKHLQAGIRDRMAEVLQPYLRKDLKIMDLYSGTGQMLKYIPELMHEMFLQTDVLGQAAGMAKNIHKTQKFVIQEEVPIGDGIVPFMTVYSALRFVNDIGKNLTKIFYIMENQGVVMSVTPLDALAPFDPGTGHESVLIPQSSLNSEKREFFSVNADRLREAIAEERHWLKEHRKSEAVETKAFRMTLDSLELHLNKPFQAYQTFVEIAQVMNQMNREDPRWSDTTNRLQIQYVENIEIVLRYLMGKDAVNIVDLNQAFIQRQEEYFRKAGFEIIFSEVETIETLISEEEARKDSYLAIGLQKGWNTFEFMDGDLTGTKSMGLRGQVKLMTKRHVLLARKLPLDVKSLEILYLDKIIKEHKGNVHIGGALLNLVAPFKDRLKWDWDRVTRVSGRLWNDFFAGIWHDRENLAPLKGFTAVYGFNTENSQDVIPLVQEYAQYFPEEVIIPDAQGILRMTRQDIESGLEMARKRLAFERLQESAKAMKGLLEAQKKAYGNFLKALENNGLIPKAAQQTSRAIQKDGAPIELVTLQRLEENTAENNFEYLRNLIAAAQPFMGNLFPGVLSSTQEMLDANRRFLQMAERGFLSEKRSEQRRIQIETVGNILSDSEYIYQLTEMSKKDVSAGRQMRLVKEFINEFMKNRFEKRNFEDVVRDVMPRWIDDRLYDTEYRFSGKTLMMIARKKADAEEILKDILQSETGVDSADEAMMTKNHRKGGVDFRSSNMPLEERGSSEQIEDEDVFDFDHLHFKGFSPAVVSVTTLARPEEFLGFAPVAVK